MIQLTDSFLTKWLFFSCLLTSPFFLIVYWCFYILGLYPIDTLYVVNGNNTKINQSFLTVNMVIVITATLFWPEQELSQSFSHMKNPIKMARFLLSISDWMNAALCIFNKWLNFIPFYEMSLRELYFHGKTDSVKYKCTDQSLS